MIHVVFKVFSIITLLCFRMTKHVNDDAIANFPLFHKIGTFLMQSSKFDHISVRIIIKTSSGQHSQKSNKWVKKNVKQENTDDAANVLFVCPYGHDIVPAGYRNEIGHSVEEV